MGEGGEAGAAVEARVDGEGGERAKLDGNARHQDGWGRPGALLHASALTMKTHCVLHVQKLPGRARHRGKSRRPGLTGAPTPG